MGIRGRIVVLFVFAILFSSVIGFQSVFADHNPNHAPNDNSNKVLTGTGPPPDKLGNQDDLYIDTASSDLEYYVKVDNNTWEFRGTLRGPAGPQGEPGLACWDTNGNGLPDNVEDVNGDGFFDAEDCVGPQGEQGEQGEQGPAGQDGSSCTTIQNDGSVTVSCDDGTTATVFDGEDGSSCSVATESDGSVSITCDDGTQATVNDGEAGSSCTVEDTEGGVRVTCDDGTEAVIFDGAPGADGLHCWDLNGNGVFDADTEDKNGDGVATADDCQGPQGDTGSIGPQGPSGPPGPQGPPGDAVPTCFGVSQYRHTMALVLSADGNIIEGEHTSSDPERVNTIEVLGMCHGLVDTDRDTGSSKFTIVKKIDKSTPLLYKALANNEIITDFELRHFRPDLTTGVVEKYFTIFGDNGRVVSVNQVMQDIDESGDDNTPIEEVTLVFNKIDWEYHPTGDITSFDRSVSGAAIGLDLPIPQCPPPAVDSSKFMTISGIDGDVTDGGLEGTIETYSVCFDVFTPIDPTSGLRTGALVGGPLTISKLIDRSTVQLYDSLLSGSSLGSVKIDFIRPHPSGDGTEQNYYRITLENAQISSISEVTPKSIRFTPHPYDAVEEVSFVYSRIISKDLVNNVETIIDFAP